MGVSKNRGAANGRFIPRQIDSTKECSRCREAKPLTEFAKDRTRFDGHAYVCRPCRNVRVAPGPSKTDRQQARDKGQAWCRGCEAWLPSSTVTRQGVCQPCANAEMRNRYATSPEFRERRRARTVLRSRGVEMVPSSAHALIMEEFDGLCAYCDKPAKTWDHVIAVRHGGLTEPANIVPACLRCNSSKRDRDVWEWLAQHGRPPTDRLIRRLELADVSVVPPEGPTAI
ncbi:HNH endonuclease [Mangrovibrevibacter kandeliae]|uniref:HNH endonuclease n=1 Tax=Mangrovibrevibacter kandeliae TaxID=2968473 RepID=UPI003558E0BF